MSNDMKFAVVCVRGFLIILECIIWGVGLKHILRGSLDQNYLEVIAGVFVCAWSSWEITKDLEKMP